MDQESARRNFLKFGPASVALTGVTALASVPLATGAAYPQAAPGRTLRTALDPGTVTFWNLFGGGDGVRLQTMLDHYTKTHGGSKSLQASTFAWGDPYYTKISLATLGGKPPDVAISHLSRMANFAKANLLSPITDEMLSTAGLSASDFNPTAWKKAQYNGAQYALPLDTHPFVLFYNKSVCQKAGLLASDGSLKPIKGTAQWEAALTAAKKVTGAYGASCCTVGDPSTSWRWFQTLYSQHSSSTPFLADAGTKLSYDNAAATATLAYMQKLTKSGLMPATIDYPGAETMLFAGKTAFYFTGEWEITTAEAVKGLKFGMVPVPTLFDRPANWADSHSFILPRMNRTKAQSARDMGFVKSMLGQSLTWAMGGHIPAYLPVKDSAAYKRLKPQSDYASAATYAYYDPPAWYSGAGSTFETTLGAQIGLVQQGSATPEKALSSFRSQISPYVNTPSPL